jgi:hypothetical protein
MKPDQARDLLDLLCAYFAKTTIPEATRDVWLAELRSIDHGVGTTAVRSLCVGSKFWPAIAELYEQVEIAREQAARARREKERRAAEETLDNLERPALREIPALLEAEGRADEAQEVRSFFARWLDPGGGLVDLPEEGAGPCEDCGTEGPRTWRLGKFRLCAKCARMRVRAGQRLASEREAP